MKTCNWCVNYKEKQVPYFGRVHECVKMGKYLKEITMHEGATPIEIIPRLTDCPVDKIEKNLI